jgi:alpha-amylase
MKRIRLIFGTHNSLPIGDFDCVFERVYQRAYKPFLTVLNRHPEFPAVLHYSGILLEWIERNHPELLMLLTDMVKRKQVELLTGGFYDPLLPLIPNPDRLGQIEKLTTYLRGQFGKRCRGSWLADGVWDPALASSLSTGGIEYTFVSEPHLRAAGVQGGEIHYPYLTEDQGKAITVYPLAEGMTEALGTGSPEDYVEALAAEAGEDCRKVVSVIPAGERLGDLEGTYQRYYDEGWLEGFLEGVLARKDVIETVIPAVHLKEGLPRKKLYFPATSYGQIMDWAGVGTMNGAAGSFRQFLSVYPESNLMYSRMLYTHLLVNQIRGDKYRKKTAREELWKGQCGAAYWHGSRGGVYSSRLRKRAYKAFIEAEKHTRDNAMFLPSINTVDFDLDGHKEYLYQGTVINAYVHRDGGALFELDFVPASWNYGDTFSRRPECYHRSKRGIYDPYPRRTFVDHFLSPESSLDEFAKMEHKELGDFVSAAYEQIDLDREQRELTLARTGSVAGQPVTIAKRYRFKKSTLYVRYELSNESDKPLYVRFASELNLSFASGISSALRISTDGDGDGDLGLEPIAVQEAAAVELRDLVNNVLMRVKADSPFLLWCLPVNAVFQAGSAWEDEYQSTCLLPQWSATLEPESNWKVELSLGVRRL